MVVEAARDKTSAMHNLFTWDRNEAARLWNLNEASSLLRHLKIIHLDGKGQKNEAPFMVSIGMPSSDDNPEDLTIGSGRKIYVRTVDALKDTEVWEEVLEQARRDLAAMARRLEAFEQLKPAARKIGKLAKEIKPAKALKTAEGNSHA